MMIFMHLHSVDKQLPVPLYHQLKTIVLESIRHGELKPNDRLPAEDELAQRYAVSKATVRQALNELAQAGILRREQGRGTFVAERKVEQGPRELTSFTQEMHKRGLRPNSRVLQQDVLVAEQEVAERLELAPGSSVFRLKRLRLADGEAMGVQTAYIPLDLVPHLEKEDLARSSLYEIFEKKYGLIPAQARETHFAVRLGAEEAELLGAEEGSAGLAAERVTLLSSGRPLELVHSVMRGDRYKIILELKRNLI